MYIVAKRNGDLPENWSYFKEYYEQDDTKYPVNTILFQDAKIFFTKEDAAKAYWSINHFFYGYKIYPYSSFSGQIHSFL